MGGIAGVPRASLPGWEPGLRGATVLLFYVSIALAALAALVVARLRDSRIARAWIALREDELAAEAMGIDRTRVKLAALAAGGFWAGIAGVLFAARTTFVSPASFTFLESTMALAVVVLGGPGSVGGVAVAAAPAAKATDPKAAEPQAPAEKTLADVPVPAKGMRAPLQPMKPKPEWSADHERVDERCAPQDVFRVRCVGPPIVHAISKTIRRLLEVLHGPVDLVFDRAAIDRAAVNRPFDAGVEGRTVGVDAIHEILQLLVAHAVGPLLTGQRRADTRDRQRAREDDDELEEEELEEEEPEEKAKEKE